MSVRRDDRNPHFAATLLPLIVLVLSLASHAPAQTTKPVAAPTVFDGKEISRVRPTTGTSTPATLDWQRLMTAMLVVVALIFALRYAAAWLFPSTRGRANTRGVRVLGRTPLAPRQQVMLIQVGRRVLVVGDSAGNLSSLANIDNPDEVAEIIGQTTSGDAPSAVGRFRSIFGTAKTDFETPHADADVPLDDDADSGPIDANVAAAQDEISGLLDRMRSLTKAAKR